MSDLPPKVTYPRDPSLQSKKYALLLLEPFLTPEVMAYLKDQTDENFEAAKDIITSPLFQTAFSEAMAYNNGEKHLDPWLGFLPDSSEFSPNPENNSTVTTPKRRGAPLGNQNARKHGFYSRRLPAAHVAGLENTDSLCLEDEINVLRIFIRRVVDLGGEIDDLTTVTNLLRTITFATMGINRLVRTQAGFSKPVDPSMQELGRVFQQAMEEEPELFSDCPPLHLKY